MTNHACVLPQTISLLEDIFDKKTNFHPWLYVNDIETWLEQGEKHLTMVVCQVFSVGVDCTRVWYGRHHVFAHVIHRPSVCKITNIAFRGALWRSKLIKCFSVEISGQSDKFVKVLVGWN